MLLLIGIFLILLILKTPVSFSLFISSLIYIVVNDFPVSVTIQRMMAGPDSFTLIAIPGFILAGAIMNTGGVTKRIFHFCDVCVGHITGGLGHSNVFASIIFAGMSGTAVADAAGLGAIELKAMKDAGYDEDFSLAVTGASSIVGPIIPPSVPAVVFGVASGVSIGRLFAAGFIPGLLMGLGLSIMIYYKSKKKGYPTKNRASIKEIWESFKYAFFPLLTPIIIVGGILVGVFTPTEAAMIAVIYSIILGFIYKSIQIKGLFVFFKETIDTTVSVMFIVSAAAIFGWILAAEQAPQMLADSFLGVVSNKYVALICINIFLLVVGCFMETIAAITILTPVLLPVTIAMGIDPVHFGIIMILNLMIGLLTPPIGMVLYVLSRVSNVPFEKISKAITPYLIMLIIILYVFTFVPQIVLFLPNLVFG